MRCSFWHFNSVNGFSICTFNIRLAAFNLFHLLLTIQCFIYYKPEPQDLFWCERFMIGSNSKLTHLLSSWTDLQTFKCASRQAHVKIRKTDPCSGLTAIKYINYVSELWVFPHIIALMAEKPTPFMFESVQHCFSGFSHLELGKKVLTNFTSLEFLKDNCLLIGFYYRNYYSKNSKIAVLNHLLHGCVIFSSDIFFCGIIFNGICRNLAEGKRIFI